ncbi:hypothetical protein [Streptomyces sp. NPDC054887]
MSVPPQPRSTTYTTGECRLGEHGLCHGNQQVRLRPGEVPVQTLRCACSCHRRR